jgi:4-amino-4-deoxy-L-arabinose transferase-like glycosyltransferase
LFIHGHIFTFKHLCLHSITKILRNGPKAHFPFTNPDPIRTGWVQPNEASVGQTCFLVIRSISHWHQARQRVVGRILFNCVILLVFLIFLSAPLSPHLPHSAFLLADAVETLAPPPSYVVSFVHFHERGLAFPLHTFDVTLFIICRCNFIT